MHIDFKKESTDELELIRDNLEDKITIIKNQIDIAKSESQSKGEYSNIEWFNKARAALRISGNQHQRVLRELGKRNKMVKDAVNNSFDTRFVNIAREKLGSELFEEIINEAKAS